MKNLKIKLKKNNLANALENADSELEEPDVKNGKVEIDVAEVAEAVCEVLAARRAFAHLRRYALKFHDLL